MLSFIITFETKRKTFTLLNHRSIVVGKKETMYINPSSVLTIG